MKKTLVMILLIAVLAIAFTGCKANSDILQPAPEEGKTVYDITASCEAELVDAATLRVTCSTNLMEGTKVAVTVDSYEGVNLAKEKISVEKESFTVDIPVKDSWKFPVTASLICTPSSNGKQLSAVKDAYGNKLQNIKGDCVLWNTDGNFVIAASEEITK